MIFIDENYLSLVLFQKFRSSFILMTPFYH